MDELNSGDTRILIDGQQGGAIVEYRTRREGGFIDWMLPGCAAHPSCFPMVPFASRIRNGRFNFGGRALKLRPNNPPEAHPIHGHGWRRSWVHSDLSPCRSSADASLSLEYLHEAADWPWRYRAVQLFELENRRLRVSLSVENLNPEPMPVGLGFHPYFPRTPNCRLHTSVAKRWRLDSELLSVSCEDLDPVIESVSFEPAQTLDAVFSDWNQAATIELADTGVRIRITAGGGFEHLVVYSPADVDFVCVEPVSNVPDAFNLSPSLFPRALFQTLAPGERVSGWMSIAPEIVGSG